MDLILLFFIVACLQTIDLVKSQDMEEGGDVIENSPSNRPCGPQMLTIPDGCCKVPRLVQVESVRSCIGGFGGGMGGGMSPKILKSFGNDAAQVVNNEGGEAVKLSMEKGPICTAECILRNQGFLNNAGDLEFELMKQKLHNGSDDEWRPVVDAAFEKCTSEFQTKRMNLPTIGNEANGCKAESTVIMTCLRRHLTLNCPETSQGKNPDGTCEKKREFLVSCDPFSLTKEASEGKFPDFIRQHLGNMMGLTNPKPGQKRPGYGLIGRKGGSWDLERATNAPHAMIG